MPIYNISDLLFNSWASIIKSSQFNRMMKHALWMAIFLYLLAMISSIPFILYHLPKSRTTQALKQKKIETAWESIKVFLTSCTDANPLHPQSNTLTAYAPYHSDKN